MLDESLIHGLLLRVALRDDGAAAAFERLYRLCAPLLLGVARRIVARKEVAEEVLHDSFARIWTNAGSYDPLAGRPMAWLVAIVRNRAIDTLMRHDVARVASFTDQGIEDADEALDRLFDWSESGEAAEDRRRALGWLRECLGRLQGAERQSLVLAYVQGLSHGELAQHLHKPLGTVKSWVRRGMANLRECVESCMRASR
jgi:RNA polymerase sigma-70 factor (ECF subfamily)